MARKRHGSDAMARGRGTARDALLGPARGDSVAWQAGNGTRAWGLVESVSEGGNLVVRTGNEKQLEIAPGQVTKWVRGRVPETERIKLA